MTRLLASLAVVCLLNPSFSQAQSAPTQTTTSPPQATTLLQQSLAALTGNVTLSDITLSGNARRIAGSDDESGTATLQAVSNGSARLQLSLSSGTFTETSNLFAVPAGFWSGPDGVSHPQALHNLFAETAWFCPALVIARRLAGTNYLASYIGEENRNGQTVFHISVSQQAPPQSTAVDPYFPHLTQVDFFLNSTTLLPAALIFDTHPDKNELVDVPVEIDFGDYQSVEGLQVPLHIQKLINNTLQLDFQAQSVTANTGLSASNFSLK